MIDVRSVTKVIENGANRVEILRGIDLHGPAVNLRQLWALRAAARARS